MQGPIGLAGKPPDIRDYRCCDVKGIVLFFEQGLLDEAVREHGVLKVFIGDYGTWLVRFSA